MRSSNTFADSVELLRRAQRGEEGCLGQLLERYRERLLVRVRLMMGSEAREHAESGDFLHAVFLKILERFDHAGPRDERAFLRWATQIARNGIRDDLRRPRELALEALASESRLWGGGSNRDDAPFGAAARAEQIAWLVDALSELGEDQRRVVELRYFEHLSFAEIGRRLGRSENAAQLLHTRVLLRLHQSFPDAG